LRGQNGDKKAKERSSGNGMKSKHSKALQSVTQKKIEKDETFFSKILFVHYLPSSQLV